MLAITSDMAPGLHRDFDRLGIDFKRNGRELGEPLVYRELGDPGLLRFPATLAVVASENDDPIQIRVWTMRGDDEARTLSEFVTRVPHDRIALLRVPIEYLCLGSGKLEPDGYVEGSCAETTVCVGGKCVPWDVDSQSLPTYAESDVFGGGSSAGDGKCLDTVPCFSEGYVVPLADIDRTDCSITTPGITGEVNIALVPADGAGGICGSDACLVPLDEGTSSGFRTEGERRILPPGVCEPPSWSLGTLIGVAIAPVTDECPAKKPSLPTCGPWSSIEEPASFDAKGPDASGGGSL